MHPHLKRGLDFHTYHINPEDAIEEVPAECRDPEQQAAKRRRIEAIASQCLRGRQPFILTAGLRGPFNHGWNNPWAEPAQHTREKRRTSDKSSGPVDSRGGRNKVTGSRKDTAVNARTAVRRGRRKHERAAKDIPAPRIASPPRITSPEASRAPEDDLDIREQDDSLNDIEVPPATAPLPDEDDASGATEYFSATTERCLQNRSPPTNPFWLRRPESTRVDMRKSTNGNIDTSPTRLRSRAGHPQSRMGAGLRLSLPKAPIRAQSTPTQATVQEEWRSSASASMAISSPVEVVNTAGDETIVTIAVEEQPPAQPNDVQTPKAVATHNTPNETGAGQCAQRIIPVITSSMGSQGRPSRDDIQRSAERFVALIPISSASNKQPRRSSRKGTPKVSVPVASPGPASSTGFVHGMVGQPKRQGGNGKRLKPRAVDFNSSPALKKKPATVVERSPENMATTQEAAAVAPVPANMEPEEVVIEPPEQVELGADAVATIIQVDDQAMRESQSSETSDWSTQAAMVRAQLEFQQSTFPTVSPGVGHLWSQPLQDTPRPMMTASSPAITPLSVLQKNSHPDASVLPISTQDLFGAASPFAFSTVKKAPQRCNLRLSFLVGDGAPTAKSPADRVPLKDKNAFWSFVTEKASQGSQKSLGERSMRSLNDIELPQLDFHTSLDDFGVGGDLHYTDRFLRNGDDS